MVIHPSSDVLDRLPGVWYTKNIRQNLESIHCRRASLFRVREFSSFLRTIIVHKIGKPPGANFNCLQSITV